MKVQLVLSFIALFSSTCFASSPEKESCLDKTNFSVVFPFPNALNAKISKEANLVQLLVFRGRGEKYVLNLSRGDISIDEFSSIDAQSTKIVHAGSANCSKPLFGADFSIKSGEAQHFHELRDEIYALFAAAKKSYGDDKSMQSKINCSLELLHDYLGDCVAIEPRKN